MAVRDESSQLNLRKQLSDMLAEAREEIPNLGSLLLFMFATAAIFRSMEFALVVTASLGVHEVGHLLALYWHGLKGRISFGVVGAWTESSLEERSRLSQMANIQIHLAGPVFSLLLAVIALALNAAWNPESRHLLILANFSAQVGLLNLIPAGPLSDGGKVVTRMLASVKGGRARKRILLAPIALTAFIVALYILVELPRLTSQTSQSFLLSLLLTGVWMAASMLLEARSQLRKAPQTAVTRPVTPMEATFITVVIWDMLAFLLIVISATPFWLEPSYVLGVLYNIYDIVSVIKTFITVI